MPITGEIHMIKRELTSREAALLMIIPNDYLQGTLRLAEVIAADAAQVPGTASGIVLVQGDLLPEQVKQFCATLGQTFTVVAWCDGKESMASFVVQTSKVNAFEVGDELRLRPEPPRW